MKFYIALAINKNDPTDIYGLCENSFSMSWERNKANLFTPVKTGNDYYNVPIRKHFEKNIKKVLFQYGYNGETENIKGRKRVTIKRLSNMKWKFYHCCGRTLQEYEWKWCNHYAIICSRFLANKENYDIKCFRVNSKYCPVKVDLSVREGMVRRKIPYKKYEWRNANFVLK